VWTSSGGLDAADEARRTVGVHANEGEFRDVGRDLQERVRLERDVVRVGSDAKA
jgi:hypothetical protein